jgi:hypothetical protein
VARHGGEIGKRTSEAVDLVDNEGESGDAGRFSFRLACDICVAFAPMVFRSLAVLSKVVFLSPLLIEKALCQSSTFSGLPGRAKLHRMKHSQGEY